MRLSARAKINLSLRVFAKRPDGYHDIESVMQSISLCDYIDLEPIDEGIQLSTNNSQLTTDSKNLAYRAAVEYQKVESRKSKVVSGIKIHIEKNIPIAAGLAGGSADAAAVLHGLNLLSAVRAPLSNSELLALGAKVGSDVPFCLTGGTCLVTGRGEKVTPLEPWPHTTFILVCPQIEVSTPWAYEAFDALNVKVSQKIKNDLEPVVVERFPLVAEIKEKLLYLGCVEAQMSGSGPSVFGLPSRKESAPELLEKVKEFYPRSFLVETVKEGLTIIK